MKLTDFFSQNVRGLAVSARASLAAPVQSLVVGDPDAFIRLWVHLLYAEGFDPDADFAAAEPSRGGFLFDIPGSDKKHRLLRDLKSGACQLAVLENGAAAPLASTGAEVASMLRSSFKLPARDWFESLCWLSASHLPSSRRGDAPTSTGSVPPGAPLSSRSESEVEAELLEAKAKDKQSGGPDVEALEFELDGLQKQRFRFDDLIAKRQTLLANVDRAERALSAESFLASVPKNFPAMVAEQQRVDRKLKDEREKVLTELRQLDDRVPPKKPGPLWKDPRVIGGTIAGLAVLVVAALLPAKWKLLGLLDVVPLGIATIQSLGWVSELQEHDEFAARRALLLRLEERFNERIEQANAAIAKVVKQSGLDLADLLAALEGGGVKQQALDRAKQVLADFENNEGMELLGQEYQRITARASEIETALLSASVGTGADSPAKRRIKDLEGELHKLRTAGHAPVQRAAPASYDYKRERQMLFSLSEILGQGLEEVARVWAERALALCQASGSVAASVTALVIEDSGRVMVDGQPLQLRSDVGDAVQVCLQLTAYALSRGSGAFPVVAAPLCLDSRALVALPEDRCVALLNELGAGRSVLILGPLAGVPTVSLV